MTSASLPKHLLPVAGVPVVARLLANCVVGGAGFQECVVVVAADDKVTIPLLKQHFVKDDENTDTSNNGNKSSSNNPLFQLTATKPNLVLESANTKVTLFQLQDECSGNVDALRHVEEASIIPASSNIVVIPGDMVVLDSSVFCNLCDTHRRGRVSGNSTGISTACTVLLADVGEQDEHGVPLKESAKVGSR